MAAVANEVRDRAREQAMASLKKADHVRVLNAELRRSLRAMRRPEALWAAAEVLENPTPEQGAIPLHRLLRMVPLFREEPRRKMLKRAGIQTWDHRLRDLTERQRLALASQMQDHAEGHWRG
jgi:hypothetical protein